MTFHVDDMGARFPGHSPEFLDLVTPGLAAAFAEIEDSQEIAGRVKVSSSAASPAAARRSPMWRGNWE